MKKAVKLGKRWYDQQMKNQFEITEPSTKSKICNPGRRRKVTAPENRKALYDWFHWRKRFLESSFTLQGFYDNFHNAFHDNWWSQQSEEIKKQPPITFSDK